MAINETKAHGLKLYRGDSGVGAGTQASKTFGTSNQQLIIKALKAGTAGNSKTAGIVVAGNNTAYSQVITASSVLVNSATDGSAAATSKVGFVISKLYEDETFRANFLATVGVGDGSGLVVAGASAALTSGANGTEVFSEILGHFGNSWNRSREILSGRHHTASGLVKRVSIKDNGTYGFSLYYDPADTQHAALMVDYEAGNIVNYQVQIQYPTPKTYQFAAAISQLAPGSDVGDFNTMQVSLELTGDVTEV